MNTFSSIRFHSLSPWVAASVCVAFADVMLPPVFAVCALHLVLQLAAFRWLAAPRAIVLTVCLVTATTIAGLLKWTTVPGVQVDATGQQWFFDPIRIWVVVALGVALLFHDDLQRVRKRRLRLRQQLQRKVRRRSAQIRRINDALRREVARRQATQQRLTRTETHLQSLAQRMQLQVLRKDSDGVITYANEAFCRNIGRAVDDVIGSTDSDLYPKATADKYRSDDAQVMASGIPVDHVESHPTADGKTGWVQVFKAPEYDENNRCIGIQMVFWDVTDTYWRTAELRRSEARKRAIFDAAREAVMLVDAQGRIVEANPAAENLLGKGSASVAGCLIDSVAMPDSQILHEGEYESSMNRPYAERSPMAWKDLPASERREMTVRRFDGTSFPAEISVHPIPLESSQGLAVFVRDVTLRHQAIRALRDAKKAAEDANRTKNEFMAGVSHEIRTPLGGITGSADLLSRMGLSPRAMQYVNMIRQSSDLLSGVITDILDFASIEAGRLQMNPEPTDLHQCVGEAFRCLATRAAGSDIEMVISIAPDVPRRVIVDAKRLRQVVMNLAGNAIKFTPRGHVMLRVSIHGPTKDQCVSQPTPHCDVLLEVIDSGIGIAKELQNKIFEPFEQGDSGTTRRYGGTGLGLAISRQLVQQMGGTIDVVSQLGHGSNFRCVLPLDLANTYTPCSPKQATPNVRVSMDVLHPVQRRALTELLTSNGYEIDRMAQVKIVDRTVSTVEQYSMSSNIDDASKARKLIWLTRVDDSTVPDGEDNLILIKPVMPDDLLRAIEMASVQSESSLSSGSRGQTYGVDFQISVDIGKSNQDPVEVPAAEQGHVLVVDDSLVNRTVIHDFLSMAGYQADVVDSGSAAISSINKARYDCVLMDLQMPEMDGVEAMTHIISRCIHLGIEPPPVIALTAHATVEHRERCLAAGMRHFLVKPIDPARLIEVVSRVSQHRRGQGDRKKQGQSSPGPASAIAIAENDWQAKFLVSTGGDPSSMRAVAEAFIFEVPQLCELMKHAASTNDPRELRRAAHTLKSCLKYVAPETDWKLFLEIENQAQSSSSEQIEPMISAAEEVAKCWTKKVEAMLTAKAIQDA